MEPILNKLAEHGIAGIFLALVIYYFNKRDKKHEQALRDKDAIISAKDEDIKVLNEKIHTLGIEAVTSVNQWVNTLKDTFLK
jgi:hypothetical protein